MIFYEIFLLFHMVECASLKTRNVFMDQAYAVLHAECQARLHANANSLVGFSKKGLLWSMPWKITSLMLISWQPPKEWLSNCVLYATNLRAKSKSCANSREMEERQIATKWRALWVASIPNGTLETLLWKIIIYSEK